MMKLFAFIVLSFSCFHAFAQNASGPVIFDVRRSLPLEPDEDVTKDFYINAGPESGMKKGVYISVVRAVPVHDPIQNKQQATLNIPVGKLRVIDVQRGITVARLESELTDDDRPTLEFEGIMVGDHVDLGTITTDAPKKPKPRAHKTASVPPPADDSDPNAGSAKAMAERAAAPKLALDVAKDAAAQAVPASAATTAAASAAPAAATLELKPAATVGHEPAASQTEESTKTTAAPASVPEEAPKKTAPAKSADVDDMLEQKKPFSHSAQADNVRVADYAY